MNKQCPSDNGIHQIKSHSSWVGYASVMVIFTMTCLAALAVMSVRAAVFSEAISKRSGEYTACYYAAEQAATRTLAELDKCANDVQYSDFFADDFTQNATEIPNAECLTYGENVRVTITAAINERQTLRYDVMFYASPQNAEKRYDILSENVITNASGENSGLNVWDGSNIPV